MIKFGFGVDFHTLKKGKTLLLGGVKITAKFGAVGDSDADVILHSISDALLASLGKGDIGTYFYKKKGIKSTSIVRFIMDKFIKNRYLIKQVQTIVFLESPPLLHKKKLIKKSIAKMLKVNEDSVNVQAKTFQGILTNTIASLSFVVLESSNL